MHDRPKSPILFTGGTGRLGRAARKILPAALYPSRQEMDITKREMLRAYLGAKKPEVIVHLAAIASIPACEKDKPMAWRVNVEATRDLLAIARELETTKLFIYLQTACIFPGDDDAAFYTEDSLPNPKHYYGLTKLVAEEAVRAYAEPNFQTIVVRTNFTTMPWEYPKAFIDRYGTYLFAQGVVKGLEEIIETKPDLPVIHLCGDKKISMYDYAVAGGSKVEKMSLADYTGPPLTVNMSLATNYWHPYKLEDSDFQDE